MTAITELELPSFDYADPSLRGERFHHAMRELREQSWIASMPLGFATLEREAGEFFLRSRAFTFPGLKIAEIFGIDAIQLCSRSSRIAWWKRSPRSDGSA